MEEQLRAAILLAGAVGWTVRCCIIGSQQAITPPCHWCRDTPYPGVGLERSGLRMALPDILHITWMLRRSDALGEKAEIRTRGARAVNVLVDTPSQWIE